MGIPIQMVKMCKKCFAIYTNRAYKGYVKNRKQCYFCRCSLFDIDGLIAEPIQKLNRKGYFTKFCCSGHICNDNAYEEKYKESLALEPEVSRMNSSGTYIAFMKEYSLPPCGCFKVETYEYMGDPDHVCSIMTERRQVKNTFSEKIENLSVILKCLDGWIERLPDNN